MREVRSGVSARYTDEHGDALPVEEGRLEYERRFFVFRFRRYYDGGRAVYRFVRLRDYVERRAAFDFTYFCEREFGAFFGRYVFARRGGYYKERLIRGLRRYFAVFGVYQRVLSEAREAEGRSFGSMPP